MSQINDFNDLKMKDLSICPGYKFYKEDPSSPIITYYTRACWSGEQEKPFPSIVIGGNIHEDFINVFGNDNEKYLLMWLNDKFNLSAISFDYD